MLKKKRKSENSITDMVRDSLHGLSRVKNVKTSIREFNALRFPAPKQYRARDVKQIREKLHVSQAVFAHLLNTEVTTVQKWERGVNVPSGPADRLLQIFEKKGSEALQLISI